MAKQRQDLGVLGGGDGEAAKYLQDVIVGLDFDELSALVHTSDGLFVRGKHAACR